MTSLKISDKKIVGGDTEKWDVRHNFVDKNESWCGIPKETRGIEEDRGK